MRFATILKFQTGVALVLSLLLLLVLTIIGVAAMNSTVMQERMAGNMRMQTQTFETASEGVSRALDYYFDNTVAVDTMVNHPDNLLCGFVHSGSGGTVVDDRLAWRFPQEGGFTTIRTDAGLRLEQQMYCCRSWTEIEITGNMVWVENPSKLFVLNRGTFLTGDGAESLARREVEVRLDEADPGLPTCAFCVPGAVGDVHAPNSNALRMHGACGPAITTEDPTGAATFIDAIDDKRIGNYDGGITSGDMGSPWNDPNLLSEFIYWVKLGIALSTPGAGNFHGYWDWSETAGTYKQGQKYRFTGNRQFGVQSDPTNTADFGQPQITYFDRSVSMGGNISGHGIMIVNGDLEWGGTPDFEGLLVVIGGNFTVSGGGGGGNPRGSIITTNIEVANADFANDLATNEDPLGTRHSLHYPIAADADGYVRHYDPDELTLTDTAGNVVEDVPVRPMLHDTLNRDLVYYNDGGNHRFFRASDGVEIDPAMIDMTDNDFRFLDPGNPGNVLARLRFQTDANRPRDKFGRLLPDFVLVDNWPHEAIEYDPNRWGWGLCGDADGNSVFCDVPAFQFGTSNFDWGGGGNQAFTYDCRWLQRTRQRLLCQNQVVDGMGNFPPAGYEYDDPDHSLVCNHHQWATEYNDDILDLAGGMNNHHSWHLWSPRCNCLGITANSDMILSGWRENLGWRDDNFAACAQLPSPPGT